MHTSSCAQWPRPRPWDTVHTAKPGPGGWLQWRDAASAVAKSLTAGTVGPTHQMRHQLPLVDSTRGGGKTHNMSMKTAGLGAVFTGTSTPGATSVGNAQTVAAEPIRRRHHLGLLPENAWPLGHRQRRGGAHRVQLRPQLRQCVRSDGCFCMTFGDGDNGATILTMVALDIAGHEMSHGVTSRSANLSTAASPVA